MTISDPGTRATHVAGSTPYAWPWNGDLNPSGTAVLVVEPVASGPLVDRGEGGYSSAVVGVVGAARAAGSTVIRVLTAAPLHAPASEWAELPVAADHTVTAAGIDGFYGSSLDALIRGLGLERLILVGAGLETSIHSTMRTANDQGYECLLVVDASIPYREELVGPSVSMIEMSGGIFGAVAHSAAVIDALVSTALVTTGENP